MPRARSEQQRDPRGGAPEPLVAAAERMRGGEAAGLRQVVDATHGLLYRLAVHLLRDADEAEDVVQETYIRAWDRRAELRDPGAVVAWLARITRNASRDRLRWWRRRPEGTSGGGSRGADVATGAAGAEERLVQAERAAGVRRALDRLSERHRVVLLLREVEEMTYDEIAEVLDLPIGTVESRLHRARAAFARQLARHGAREGT